MSNIKDAVGYPYDWQNREEEELIESYWAAHGRTLVPKEPETASAWANGRLALAAVVWGLIIMLVLSVQP